MALPVLVYVAQELASTQEILVQACNHAARPEVCAPTRDRARAFAVVERAGARRYRVLVRGQAATPLTFSAQDDPEERARSLGITVGVLAAAAREQRQQGPTTAAESKASASEAQGASAPNTDAPVTEPPLADPDDEETIDLAIPAVATGEVPGEAPEARERRVRLHAIVGGLVGNGTRRLRAGTHAMFGLSPASLPLGGFVTVRALWDAGASLSGVRSRWLAVGAGVFCEVDVAFLRVDARLGTLQESWRAVHRSSNAPTETEGRSYTAVMAGAGVSLPLTGPVGVRLGGVVSTSPGHEIRVEDRLIGHNPRAAGFLDLGVAGVF